MTAERGGPAGARPAGGHGTSGSAVALDGIDVDIAGVPVLRGVDLQVRLGEVVGLVGANGSGKSTLLRVLATLLRPVGGTGQVLGAPLGSARAVAARPSIALVGHQPALYPRLSLAENLRFVARLTGRSEADPARVLAAVGLGSAGGRRAAHCSHGMLRRAELARVLLVRPRLLLLDEAHTGLDETSAGLVDAVVARVRQDGGATVLVSHERARLQDTVDRVEWLADGRVRPDPDR